MSGWGRILPQNKAPGMRCSIHGASSYSFLSCAIANDICKVPRSSRDKLAFSVISATVLCAFQAPNACVERLSLIIICIACILSYPIHTAMPTISSQLSRARLLSTPNTHPQITHEIFHFLVRVNTKILPFTIYEHNTRSYSGTAWSVSNQQRAAVALLCLFRVCGRQINQRNIWYAVYVVVLSPAEFGCNFLAKCK